MRSWKRRFTVMFLLAVWTAVVAASAATMAGRNAPRRSFAQHVYDMQPGDGPAIRSVATLPPLFNAGPPVVAADESADAEAVCLHESSCLHDGGDDRGEIDNEMLTEILRVRKSLRSDQTAGSQSDACSEQDFADALRQVMKEPRSTVAYEEQPAPPAAATTSSLVLPPHSPAPACEPPLSEPPRFEPPHSEPPVARSLPPSLHSTPYSSPAATNYGPADLGRYEQIPIPSLPYVVESNPNPYAPPPPHYGPRPTYPQPSPSDQQWCETATVNTRSDAVAALRRIGRQLDLLAADMEDQRQFEDAESLRKLVCTVRAEARRIEEAKGNDGRGERVLGTYTVPPILQLP